MLYPLSYEGAQPEGIRGTARHEGRLRGILEARLTTGPRRDKPHGLCYSPETVVEEGTNVFQGTQLSRT